MVSKNQTAEPKEKRKNFKVPHIFVILFLMIALASLVSYIIPAGQFERVANESGAEVIQPGTFQYIEASPVTFFEFMFAIPDGFIQTAEIIFGIIMIGGMFSVIERTGVISLAVNKLASKFANRGMWIIPTLMIPFALFTTFTGQVEMSLIYLPAILPLVLKLGFDRITATAIVLVSTIAGFSLALTVPANLGVAQDIAELPLYSGMWYRIILLAVVLSVGMAYVWRYAKKVKENPALSIVFDEEDDHAEMGDLPVVKATKRQLWTALTLLVAFGILLFGLLNYGWYFRELTGLYALIGIVAGLVAGLKSSEIADAFNEGFKKILLGAIVVGIARGIAVVLDAGDIMDTIIYALGEFVGIMPDSVTAVFMLVVQAALNFLIPSGSGQAMVTMPIMSGLSDISGVTRQTAVLAFLMGDGFTNIFYPTSGYFMATLAVGGVRWEKWLKFIFPLLIVWYSVAIISLIIAQIIDYGPL
ncbi:YfcC family protein [Planomicrobium sp. CPCC 101079]|uniref:YfcC family protein n=1 Tax=Planomicrobium sp. CPCC 101079 TaxID=2599618 RepID=UPI0011B4B2F3|nr:YfcC family protein [Planomicrobium sp. CPCC 101079]TWT01520.1 YfcC family protein [Planomicrobium sp. CPCC 101079]